MLLIYAVHRDHVSTATPTATIATVFCTICKVHDHTSSMCPNRVFALDSEPAVTDVFLALLAVNPVLSTNHISDNSKRCENKQDQPALNFHEALSSSQIWLISRARHASTNPGVTSRCREESESLHNMFAGSSAPAVTLILEFVIVIPQTSVGGILNIKQ